MSCKPCRGSLDLSEMTQKNMRHHIAGHAFLSDVPMSICGFCGVGIAEMGCSLVVKLN